MPLSDQPMPSSFDDDSDFRNESGLEKMMRRFRQEPLVPLGCLLTVAAFTNAYRASRRGDHQQVQRMFRARVLAQAFTIVAMVGGGIYYGAERQKERELWKLQQNQRDEEKRSRWIRELEARDAEEKHLQDRLAKRRARKVEQPEVPEDEAAPQGEIVAAASAASAASGGSFLGGLLGRDRKSETATEAVEPAPAPEAAAATVEETAQATPAPAEGKKKSNKSSLSTLGGLFSKNTAAKTDEEEK